MGLSLTNFIVSRFNIIASFVPALLSWPPKIITSLFEISVAVSASTDNGNFIGKTLHWSDATSYYSIESILPEPS